MINERLFEEFVTRVKRGPILESGISRGNLTILGSKFKIASFDASSSRFSMTMPGFRGGTMIKLPYDGLFFGGFISKYIFDKVGDREYFFKDILRVTDGPMLMVEAGVDSFPQSYLSEVDDVMVNVVSINGNVHEINQTWAQLFSRRDLRKLFTPPSGALNKFNTLVPEDIKVEVGVLQSKF